MAGSLKDILVREVSAPAEDSQFLKDYWSKKYFDWSSEDAGNAAIGDRIYQQRLSELSALDLLKANTRRGVVQSGVPLNAGMEEDLIKRMDAAGWDEQTKKAAVLSAIDKHFQTYGQPFTEWSGTEGIAGLLGLPTGDTAAEYQKYAGAHAKDAASADANSQTNAIQLASVLFAPFAAAGISGLGAGAAGGGAAGGGAGALEAAGAFGGEAFGAAANSAGAFGGSVAPWTAGAGAAATTGGGMDWFSELMQNYNPDLGFQGLNEAGSGLTGGMGTAGVGGDAWFEELIKNYNPDLGFQGLNEAGSGLTGGMGSSGILDTLKNLPTSALKSLGIQNPDGSLNTKTLGALLSAGLGAYGANQQSNSLEALANKYSEYGAPYRSRLAASYADPAGFLANSPDIKASVDQGTSALARALSTKGNPTGSGSALHELQNYATQGLYGQLGNERNRLANFGGLSNFNAAAPGLAGQQIQAEGGVLNAIGSGISSITNPQTTLEQALNALNGNNFKIGAGTGLA